MRTRVMLAVLFLIVAVMTVLFLPRLVVEWELGSAELQRLNSAEQAKATNDIRTTLLQGLGGLALLIGAYLTWRQMQFNRLQMWEQQNQFELTFVNSQQQFERTLVSSQDQFERTFETSQAQLQLSYEQARHALESSQQELALNREALLSDRFVKAVEQIGSENSAVRVVGLHTLQILELSPREREAVPRMIAGFILQHAPWTPDKDAELTEALNDERTWTEPWPSTSGGLTLPPWIADLPSLRKRAFDVHTALEALYRVFKDRSDSLVLQEVDLRKLDLESGSDSIKLHGIHFHGAHFEGSYLVGVDFSASQLDGAHFEGATMVNCQFGIELRKARFDGAEFQQCTFPRAPLAADASFRKASFQGDLHDAVLNRADLRGAHMIGVNLKRASLQDADLTCADLNGANLEGSDLRGARLQRAELDRANLKDALWIGADFNGATANPRTTWPQGFDPAQAGVSIRKQESVAEYTRRRLYGDC
jgi:uncharacterized protein YjbI with pentapeptide repeats